MRLPRRSVAFAFLVGVVLASAHANAEPTDDAHRRRAARVFAEGQRAFNAGDFYVAARAFEAAHKLAPHHDVLWNAARAWHRAGERARAANLYAEYLEIAPSDALDRGRATASLGELGPKLGRIEMHRASDDVVAIDDEITNRRQLWVNPGAHSVRIRTETSERTQVVVALAGTVVSVTSQSEAPVAEPSTSTESPAAPGPSRRFEAPSSGPSDSADTRAHGWSPAIVYAGGALSVVSAGLTVWAGLATFDARSDFDASPTQANLDRGRTLQTLTNAGIGLSAALGGATIAAALFLVDWRKPRSHAGLQLDLDAFGVHGSF